MVIGSHHLVEMVFQFPLSERTNCNIGIFAKIPRTCPFFQFPLSERTNCNYRAPARGDAIILLSVSSIGTNELQHEVEIFDRALTENLSVSSIGTNELQHIRHANNSS